MVTAQELAVKIKSEGVSETRDGVESVGSAMEDTAERAGDSAEELQGFSEQFQGAMSTAVTALAIGAAGLLSQVPVLGEAFSGLAAIVDAIALKMDKVLRPVLTPITNAFFKVANGINDADGIMGKIIGTIASIVSIGSILIGIVASIGSVLGVWASTAAGVSSILGTLASIVGTVIGVIAGLPATLIAVVAAIAGFALAYLTNWRGMRDKTNKIVGKIIDFVVGGFKSFVSSALDKLNTFVGDVKDFFSNLASDLSGWAGDVASDAKEWGKDIIRGMIDGMTSLAESVAKAVETVINGMIRVINTALDQLPDQVTSRLGVESFSMVDFDTSFGASGIAGGTPGGRGRPIARTANGQGVSLDGRTLTESTGRYRSDPSRRRGL